MKTVEFICNGKTKFKISLEKLKFKSKKGGPVKNNLRNIGGHFSFRIGRNYKCRIKSMNSKFRSKSMRLIISN